MIRLNESFASITRHFLAGLALTTCLVASQAAYAQFGFGNLGRLGVVGGIRIDADGTVQNASVADR